MPRACSPDIGWVLRHAAVGTVFCVLATVTLRAWHRSTALEATQQHMVVVVHGFASSDLMVLRAAWAIDRGLIALGKRPASFVYVPAANSGWADACKPLPDAASDLAEELVDLVARRRASGRRVSRVSFVGISLGSVVARLALSRLAEAWQGEVTFGAFLSLAAPHAGARGTTCFPAAGVSLAGWASSRCQQLQGHVFLEDARHGAVLSARGGLDLFRERRLYASRLDTCVPYWSATLTPDANGTETERLVARRVGGCCGPRNWTLVDVDTRADCGPESGPDHWWASVCHHVAASYSNEALIRDLALVLHAQSRDG